MKRNNTIRTVSVIATEESSRTLRLRTELAHGHGPQGAYDVCLNADNAALIVTYADRQFVVALEAIVRSVLEIVDGGA